MANTAKVKPKSFFLWIVSDEELTELVRDEDDKFAALEGLFKKITRGFSSGTETHKPFIGRIDGNDRLMEVAIEEFNWEAVEWFQDYITETAGACSGNNDEASTGCFTVFCKIGKDTDKDSREDWLRFETFEEYIVEIIDTGINKNNWKNGNNIQDADDVTDFYEELCGNLVTAEE